MFIIFDPLIIVWKKFAVKNLPKLENKFVLPFMVQYSLINVASWWDQTGIKYTYLIPTYTHSISKTITFSTFEALLLICLSVLPHSFTHGREYQLICKQQSKAFTNSPLLIVENALSRCVELVFDNLLCLYLHVLWSYIEWLSRLIVRGTGMSTVPA